MNISKEDRELIRKFEQIMNKGHYVQSQQLTDAYNRILDKHVHNTTCGSCLRQRTKELIDALNNVERREAREQEAAKKAIEEAKEQEVDNLPEDEKKEAEELAFAQNSGFSTVEEARLESEIIMQEHEEQIKELEEELALRAKLESKGFLTEEEENNNGTEGKSPTTAKKRKASKPKTT